MSASRASKTTKKSSREAHPLSSKDANAIMGDSRKAPEEATEGGEGSGRKAKTVTTSTRVSDDGPFAHGLSFAPSAPDKKESNSALGATNPMRRSIRDKKAVSYKEHIPTETHDDVDDDEDGSHAKAATAAKNTKRNASSVASQAPKRPRIKGPTSASKQVHDDNYASDGSVSSDDDDFSDDDECFDMQGVEFDPPVPCPEEADDDEIDEDEPSNVDVPTSAAKPRTPLGPYDPPSLERVDERNITLPMISSVKLEEAKKSFDRILLAILLSMQASVQAIDRQWFFSRPRQLRPISVQSYYLILKTDPQWFLSLFSNAISDEVKVVLSKGAKLKMKDLIECISNHGRNETRRGVYINVIMSDERENLYVGSTPTNRGGLQARIKQHTTTIRSNRNQSKGYHYVAARQKDMVSHFRVLATFPDDISAGYTVLLESVAMLFLNTFTRSAFKTEYSEWAPRESYKFCEDIRRDLSSMLPNLRVTGANNSFPAFQGFKALAIGSKKVHNCENCQEQIRGKPYKHDLNALLVDTYLCGRCRILCTEPGCDKRCVTPKTRKCSEHADPKDFRKCKKCNIPIQDWKKICRKCKYGGTKCKKCPQISSGRHGLCRTHRAAERKSKGLSNSKIGTPCRVGDCTYMAIYATGYCNLHENDNRLRQGLPPIKGCECKLPECHVWTITESGYCSKHRGASLPASEICERIDCWAPRFNATGKQLCMVHYKEDLTRKMEPGVPLSPSQICVHPDGCSCKRHPNSRSMFCLKHYKVEIKEIAASKPPVAPLSPSNKCAHVGCTAPRRDWQRSKTSTLCTKHLKEEKEAGSKKT